MAKTKKTIATFIKEHEAYLSSIQGSVSRVANERDEWVRELESLAEKWSGAPVVANAVASHSQEAWWSALERTDVPELQKIWRDAEDTVSSLVRGQRLAKDNILECTRLSQELGLKLQEADVTLGNAEDVKKAALSRTKAAVGAREASNDAWLDAHVKKWERQGVASRAPMNYDYSAPQPWWAKQWLLSVINSEMATNMQDARQFEEKTGTNLYAVAQGYQQRLADRDQTQAAYRAANSDAERIERVHNALVQEQSNNEFKLQRSIKDVFPTTGPVSLKSQSLHARTSAVEDAARYCIMNNVDNVAGLALVLPNADAYAQQAGKYAAMQKVADSLKSTTAHWRQGEQVVNAGLAELKKLSRKHSTHTSIGLDTTKTQDMTENIERASIGTHARAQSARPLLHNPSPFSSNSFSTSRNASATTTTSNSNDSLFWTIAWMHLLTSNSHAASINQSTSNISENGTLPLLDPQQFENNFNNANGGLGLTSGASFENIDKASGLSVDWGQGMSIVGNDFAVDIPSAADLSTNSGGGSGFSDYSSPSSYDSGSSYSSSSSSSDSSSSSSGSSCGGGGD